MYHSESSSVDPSTGNVSWNGQLDLTKGDHSHMPQRTDAYLPGYERGHVNASSLGGVNTASNVVAQHHDVNHGAYYSMERGERTAMKNGAEIHSSKTAIVDGKPGDRPEAFLVSDTITYADGHMESVHHSFTNTSYAEQEAWNNQSASLPGTFEASNPGDELRDSMNPEAYSELMENTDAELPCIAEDYAPADFSGMPETADTASESDAATETDAATDADTDAGEAEDTGADAGVDADSE